MLQVPDPRNSGSCRIQDGSKLDGTLGSEIEFGLEGVDYQVAAAAAAAITDVPHRLEFPNPVRGPGGIETIGVSPGPQKWAAGIAAGEEGKAPLAKAPAPAEKSA